MPFTSSVVTFLSSSAFTAAATADGVLTRARNRFTAAKCPAALREASASRGDAQRRASSVRVSPEVSLTERTREVHGWVWMYGEACHALLRLPPALCQGTASGLLEFRKGLTEGGF
jgi:hypothetical protein